MNEWLDSATVGVDPAAPDAFWRIFFNLMRLVPWAALFWWSLLFVLVGALLGWWRGRLVDGVVWATLLGPLGWFVVLARPRRRQPPPLPGRRRGRGVQLPPR